MVRKEYLFTWKADAENALDWFEQQRRFACANIFLVRGGWLLVVYLNPVPEFAG